MSQFITSRSANNYSLHAGPLACGINTPPARKTRQGGLPPYAPRGGFLVDEYPACPKHWLRSKGSTTSYFVGVEEETGLWLDFNRTLDKTPQHVAMVISIQGVNAITGMPCEDAQLEQFTEKCPKHKKEFGPHRFCAECNFQWPKQNYICSTGQPVGELWLDGFRAADGIIRQYVFTKNEARGVANAVLGKKRVFAIGISCFLSKAPRPAPVAPTPRAGGVVFNYTYSHPVKCKNFDDTPIGSDHSILANMDEGPSALYSALSDSDPAVLDATPMAKSSLSKGYGAASASNGSYSKEPRYSAMLRSTGHNIAGTKTSRLSSRENVQSRALNAFTVQQVEVAAGEQIDQKIYDDPHPLDFWHDKPESILVINYALVVDAEKILAGGKIDLKGSSEGFLQNIPTGNAVAAS